MIDRPAAAMQFCDHPPIAIARETSTHIANCTLERGRFCGVWLVIQTAALYIHFLGEFDSYGYIILLGAVGATLDVACCKGPDGIMA